MVNLCVSMNREACWYANVTNMMRHLLHESPFTQCLLDGSGLYDNTGRHLYEGTHEIK